MRLGINIPNSLHKRIEPLRDQINISQICRDAIEEWVNAYEKSIEKVDYDGVGEVADKLKEAWKAYIVDRQEVGRQDAKIWAEKATSENFAHFAHNLKVGRGHGRTPGVWMAPHLPDTPMYHGRQQEHETWFIQEMDIDQNSNPYLKATEDYEIGWTSYLITILNQAKEDKQWIH